MSDFHVLGSFANAVYVSVFMCLYLQCDFKSQLRLAFAFYSFDLCLSLLQLRGRLHVRFLCFKIVLSTSSSVFL